MVPALQTSDQSVGLFTHNHLQGGSVHGALSMNPKQISKLFVYTTKHLVMFAWPWPAGAGGPIWL